MIDEPIVERVHSAVCTAPTDAPEADGTLAREARGIGVSGHRTGQPV